jgi:hypothetical protein
MRQLAGGQNPLDTQDPSSLYSHREKAMPYQFLIALAADWQYRRVKKNSVKSHDHFLEPALLNGDCHEQRMGDRSHIRFHRNVSIDL